MRNEGPFVSSFGLERHGLLNPGTVHWNLPPARLYEEAVRRGEAQIGRGGPLVATTGKHTGRSPNDKFIVRESSSEANIAWGKVNQPMEEAQWDALHRDLLTSLKGKELYVLDAFAGTIEVAAIDEDLDRLTEREREVMRLIARGYAYKEVAKELFISIKTVETHMSSVLRKLQLSSRHELTRWASDRRLL